LHPSWSQLPTDDDAVFDKEVNINASEITPTITYGTHPGMAFAIDGLIPVSNDASDISSLEYMQFTQGESILGKDIDLVFIGSCTNSRISDLRNAAKVMQGKHVQVRTLVVAGSELIKLQAEAEGLDKVFLAAGAEWREPGCSMCLGMNGDIGKPGDLVVSTSNRNFIGRQGKDVRTILASPLVAASSALKGQIADPRVVSNTSPSNIGEAA